MKKGAMFGLDARIALAIFGALSVISGAALYSAIKQANVASEAASMVEFGKAVEAFLLDTGVDFPAKSGRDETDTERAVQNLIESSIKGWQVPYFKGIKTGSDHVLEVDTKASVNYLLYWLSADDWPDTSSIVACSAGKNCAYFLKAALENIPESSKESFVLALEKYFDGENGSLSTGNFRVTWVNAEHTNVRVFYKIAPTFYKF
jgi:hypothetical protein